jgi:phosphoglycolate phosphatase-like HAD superfamily hydrolase
MLLITDLDNTLYDWVTFFAESFQAMLRELALLLGRPESELIQEFKSLHQHYGTSEQPFVVLELPAVREHFGSVSQIELLKLLNVPLHAFNRARKQLLKLYDGVDETMRRLSAEEVTIVGHTEAIAANAFYRLRRLGIQRYFTRLYALEGNFKGHPDPVRAKELQPPPGFVRFVSKGERKPNPLLLRDICAQEGKSVHECWYVGDSIVRDISMAREAGVNAVWARYGTRYDRKHWDLLVKITHWTKEDVVREEQLHSIYDQVQPDHTIDSFDELMGLMLSHGRSLEIDAPRDIDASA